MNRRQLLRHALAALATAPALLPAAAPAGAASGGLAATLARTRFDKSLNATLPEGASLRIVARSGQAAVAGGGYSWHGAPDGGACFSAADGGWVYVSNSELPDLPGAPLGGAGALRFDAAGRVVDSYPILEGTRKNCAGGRTPWQTWLSCEEYLEFGQVYECDPLGKRPARVLPAMGSFCHEAVAIDPQSGTAYLTEDQPDGCLYRFTPARRGDLTRGTLEVAVPGGNRLDWRAVPDPSAQSGPLRYQRPEAARFDGGEGIIHHAGTVFFTTKGDNRVWSLELDSQRLGVVYDAALSSAPILRGVDNLEIAPGGELLVAEDGDDMQIVALTDQYVPVPVLTLYGQSRSEITGPAYSPDGSRLYFSSQRGPEGLSSRGLTYELTLPA